jgi:tetratricopeptide (TPR) repeat protein
MDQEQDHRRNLGGLRAAVQLDPNNVVLAAHFGRRLAEYRKGADQAEVQRAGAEADFQTVSHPEARTRRQRSKKTAHRGSHARQLNLGLAEEAKGDWALYELGTHSGGEEGAKLLLAEAVAAYRSALEIYTKADLPQDWAQTQNNLGAVLEALGNQLEAEEGLKRKCEAVELLRDVMSYQAGDLSRYRLASALGGLAFHLLLSRHFVYAQANCEDAQALADKVGDGIQKTDREHLILIQQNLAHALLLQGHYDEALAIYRQSWDKPLNGKTFGKTALEDFAVFDKVGLTHPDLSRMKQALADLGSNASSQ